LLRTDIVPLRRIMALVHCIAGEAMDKVDQPSNELVPERTTRRTRHVASISFAIGAAVLLVVVLVSTVTPRTTFLISIAFVLGLVAFTLLMARFSHRLRREERATATVLQTREQEFQQMAGNIQEIFWMIDAETKQALYVNDAYETITGRPLESLKENPSSYVELIHPDDRIHVLAKLDEAAVNGRFDEQFRIVRADGQLRWVWVRGFPRRDAEGKITRLGGTAMDITAQKAAEGQVTVNLAMAKSAWAEAEALRKATLALTQDLHMDSVMDALLRSLADLIPYTCARVLVPEGGPHVLALGEKFSPALASRSSNGPLTLIADDSPFLQRILAERKSVLIPDTRSEQAWQSFQGHAGLGSWLSVPLVASDDYLGFLSVGHAEPNHLTEEHLRRAQLLAIPAAVAIQNARLFALADIYGSELEKRLADLQAAERALNQAETGRRVSEEKFQRIFHASPIPFSITTFEEGRFLEVNAAFERRYGYSRRELLGRTVYELGIWEDRGDRVFLLTQLRQCGPVRHVITKVRTKAGEIKVTDYSAERIQFDGQSCIFAVSEDVVVHDPGRTN
jgi:PAS domain S-box-containing protein